MRRIFDVANKGKLTGHRDCIYALVEGANPFEVISAGSDGLVVNWDLRVENEGKVLARVPQSVYSLAINTQNELYIGQNFSGINKIDLNTLVETKSPKLTETAVFDLLLLDEHLVIATGEGSILLLDAGSLKVIKDIQVSQQATRCLCFISNLGWIAAGFSDGWIRVFDTKLNFIKGWPAHTNSVFSLYYDLLHNRLLSGSRDAHLKSWQIDADSTVSLEQDIPAHLYAINAITASSDGRFLATASMDKSIKIWDRETLTLLKVLDKGRHAGHATSVNRLVWLSYDNLLISGSDDRTCTLWNISESTAAPHIDPI